MSWFKKIFVSFWSLFRTGLERFLVENIEEAKDLLLEAWMEAGKPANLATFKDQVFVKFQDHFRQSKGTWVSILIDLAWDAIKKSIDVGRMLS